MEEGEQDKKKREIECQSLRNQKQLKPSFRGLCCLRIFLVCPPVGLAFFIFFLSFLFFFFLPSPGTEQANRLP